MTDKTLPANLEEYTGGALYARDSGTIDQVLEMIETEATSIVPDTSSKKGRDSIASLAYRIARSKTYVDNAGKEKTAEARNEIKRIDALRKHAREFLDALKTQVRGPLDDWETEQERIKAEQKERLDAIERIQWPEDIEQIRAQLAELQARELQAEDFGDHFDRAVRSLGFAISGGEQAIEAAEDIEAKKREAEKLREELAELKRQAEALEAEKRELENEKRRTEAKEQAKRDKAEAAKRKRAEAKEQKEREARIAKEAAEKATREAEERAEAARQAEERERQQTEARRIAREAAEAEIERQRAEAEKNVALVHAEVLGALLKIIDDEKTASAVLSAIRDGQIPRVSIDY